MRTLLALLWFAVAFATPAFAQETSNEPSGTEAFFAKADDLFSRYVVTPLDNVLFFDVWRWDNTVRDARAIGAVVGDERVTEVSDQGLHWQRQYELTAPGRVLTEPTLRDVGNLEVTLQPTGGEAGMLVVQVLAQPVDLEALGIEPVDPEAPGEPARPVVVPEGKLAPFRIRVDPLTAQTVPSRLKVPEAVIPYEIGERVMAEDGTEALVRAINDDGTIAADSVAVRIAAGSVPNPRNIELPLVVLWLVLGATFFTLRMAFVNLRLFGHAVAVTLGRYDTEGATGEISHFQALSSALSATVGLGNIAGVAIAVGVGGPGAVVWMVLAGFLGMSSKFVECTLGQMYRVTRPDGSVSGGPMHYLSDGLKEINLGGFGRVLAVIFALMCIGGSFGGGNMFQSNQSSEALAWVLNNADLVGADSAATVKLVYGLAMTFFVGLVIIGGIQRIGAAAGLIVPFMCGLYLLAGLFVLLVNVEQVPSAFGRMISGAFSPEAQFGGLMGVLVQGFRRAAFSNEAGVGSASIAHSAATTDYPVREGIVALLEPFIDTIIVCTMTGLVVVVTNAQAESSDVVATLRAFGSVVPWFPGVLTVAVVLFAFSTMISWSYYGERCAVWLFGDGAKLPYRLLFLVCVFMGANLELASVLTFSDLMILGMAFPNIMGAVFLAGKVKAALDDYTQRLRNGEFPVNT